MSWQVLITSTFYSIKNDGILSLPKSPHDFADLKSTLDLLFCYQHFILELGHEAQSALQKRQDLNQICEATDVSDEIEAYQQHNI
ncbi:uncharacterized protein BX664DRAFT_320826 [Halteromyces radiatus]|uniref:uncharacterized protein n=1 Tax=Halteromyces radiatus TaxID=101107 RepID=UPI00221E383D|nr:uncharacterized protein BX664DRAFT_320826 [Halteromyces radiatus]KAI8099248.1 hypothetical protein BX664DRAFT_320826 [Halteromyces radiatus]